MGCFQKPAVAFHVAEDPSAAGCCEASGSKAPDSVCSLHLTVPLLGQEGILGNFKPKLFPSLMSPLQ